MARKDKGHKPYPRWPLFLIASPAATAVWSGWVGLGGKTGFGPVHLFPGVSVLGLDHFVLNTAITLPIGVEAYGAYALGAWLHPRTPKTAKKFAKRSAIGSLVLGTLGQVSYHLMAAANIAAAPWWITMMVSALPVITLGFGAGLTHLLRDQEEAAEPAEDEPTQPVQPTPVSIPGVAPVTFPSAQETAEARRNAAMNIVQERPELLEEGKAAELGRVLGMSERTGQRLAKQLRSVRGGTEWQNLAPDNL